jgi:hypothetical protein
VSLLSSAFVPSLKAGESDKKTIITIAQPLEVEGTVLPADRYVLKLLNFLTDQNIVQIYNGKETSLITTILAIPAFRLKPIAESQFSFYEAAAEDRPALRTWFYPGDNFGFEFRQAQHAAAGQSVGAGAAQ